MSVFKVLAKLSPNFTALATVENPHYKKAMAVLKRIKKDAERESGYVQGDTSKQNLAKERNYCKIARNHPSRKEYSEHMHLALNS